VNRASKEGDFYHPWSTYIFAREEARRRGDRRVGTEHLVLGLLHDEVIEAALGVSLQSARDALDALDSEALRAIGFDTDIDAPPLPMRGAPARPTINAVLKDRLPMTPAAKKALQDSGKPMRRGRHISPQEVLLRLLEQEPPDPGAVLFAAVGIDVKKARGRLVVPPSATWASARGKPMPDGAPRTSTRSGS
jgi:hypothetical protein